MFGSENDISLSIISSVERGIKDPQFSTLYRLSEACNISFVEFITKITITRYQICLILKIGLFKSII